MESFLGKNNSSLNLSQFNDELFNSNKANIPDNDIYLFFSFDLIGSTKLKTENNNWPDIIFRFYEILAKEMQNKLPQVIVWKYLGDEVLLHLSIQDLELKDTIFKIPEIIYNIQDKVSDDLYDSFKIRYFLKSTIWMAGINSEQSKQFVANKTEERSSNYPNLRLNLNSGKQYLPDFIGPDMDIGFRIAKYAYHHKVTISANFAYFLLKKSKKNIIKNNIKVVSFEQLKGVWRTQYYPIIWYYPDWNHIEENCFYSDHKENEIIDRIMFQRYYSLDILEKVFTEIEKSSEINSFIDECEKLNAIKNESTVIIENNIN